MSVNTVLAVICVSDPERARRWYEQLFDRPADTNPMGSLQEWKVTDNAWLQVFEDPEHAGKSFVTLGTDDLDEDIADLGMRGLTLTEIEADPPMRLAQIADPDGNVITFGQKLKGH